LPGHWKVDGDCVTLFDTERFEDISDAANFTEKFAIADETALVRLVCLPDDGGLDGGRKYVKNEY
jgi:hypothetical protein